MSNDVTVYDIAKAAGVSRTTVLRALSDKPDINPETKARIKEVARQMRYRPNYLARSLTLGRSMFVGVIVYPSLYPTFHQFILCIESALREEGYSMLLYISGRDDAESDEHFVEQLMKNRVDGVIAVPGSKSMNSQPYQELVDSGVHLVTVDGCIEGLSIPQVTADNYQAGKLATEHLISLGHRNIVYMGIPRTSYVGRERAKGFTDAMAEAGISVEPSSIIEIGFDEDRAEEVAAKVLKRSNPPTAILTRHDITARGAMRAAFAAGLRVPEDISIVGNGNIPGSDMFRVPLTTVNFPGPQMAKLSVQKLLELLDGKDVPPDITVFGVEFVERSSAAPPRKR
jgi:DNA-binding LacI/PurR family transcriptional regulator